VRLALVGAGAAAAQHARVLAATAGADIVTVVGVEREATRGFARDHGIPEWTLALDEVLARPDVHAVILATPTPLHAAQAIRCLEAGKHTLVEIPVADSLADAERVAAAAAASGCVAMVCHTRRFNAGHRWIHRQLRVGAFELRHLIVSTLFLRREDVDVHGRPRGWTDDLLWHHAGHTVDLFAHQTGEQPSRLAALAGPPDPTLGIALDASISLATPSGALCSVALSFNHEGPFGTTFRYVTDRATYVASYDDLADAEGRAIDVAAEVATDVPTGRGARGIATQDREFLSAIREEREPASSVRACLPAMRTLDRLAFEMRTSVR
jgi:2-hydroxy-4-carboxymuconate semialdehyde hemiacetal dehydrogenase